MLHRYKTFESYFEINIDDIGEDEHVSTYLNKIVTASTDELYKLAITKIGEKIISICHEKGFEILNIDEEKGDFEIENHHKQCFILSINYSNKRVLNSSLRAFALKICVLRSEDPIEQKNYKVFNTGMKTYDVLSEFFKMIKNEKAITLNCQNGKKYYMHESLLKDLDKESGVNYDDLDRCCEMLTKNFKVLNIMLSGKNDFSYKGRKFRLINSELLHLA